KGELHHLSQSTGQSRRRLHYLSHVSHTVGSAGCRREIALLGIERWTLSVGRWTFSAHGFKRNASSARLSDAGGMGAARCDLAVLAAPRRNQFSRFVRSRFADAARNDWSAD